MNSRSPTDLHGYSPRRTSGPAGIAWLLATLALSPLGVAFADPTPAQLCEAAKNKEAGKYDLCRQKAEGKFAVSGDSMTYTAMLASCLTKFQRKWPVLEARATAQGGACPSVGDQADIQGLVDASTTNIATALAGGSFDDCPIALGTCNGNLTTCQAAPKSQRLATGQITCNDAAGNPISCAGTGQDGDFRKGLTRSYADNGDGTITDNRTALMWEKLSSDGSIHDKDATYDWTSAFTKVATLNSTSFAGFNDWRLPNVNELQSLATFDTPNPSIDAAFNTGCAASCTVLTCSCTHPYNHWTSTSYNIGPSFAWRVDFGGGGVLAELKSTNYYYVRAVRGGP